MVDSLQGEVEGAEFGDLRLTKRLSKIVDALGRRPNMSIPAATKGRPEMEAAYRFFDNPKVTPDAISQPHVEATHQRISQNDVVLLVQDTTEIDLTRPKQQVAGAGPIDSSSRNGAFYHPLKAFAPSGLPLGVCWSKSWSRKSLKTKQERSRHKRLNTPIEEKESFRWLEGVHAARGVAEACPFTQCVCIADSEADIYELFVAPRSTSVGKELHLLVRASQPRALSDGDGQVLDAVRATPELYRETITVSPRGKPKTQAETRKRKLPRDARIAEVEVRAATVTLRPPYRPDSKLPEVTLNVVLAEETNVSEGQIAVQWILITTLPIDDIDQVKTIIGYYRVRWQIEVFFRTLKTGCRVELRYFERLERLLNCLATYSIVAWRVMYLTRLSRECPELDCEVVFEPSEWKAVYMTVKQKDPPDTPPTLNEITRMVASLGGYVIRGSTQPGTQTMWLGLQRLFDLSTAWQSFGPPEN